MHDRGICHRDLKPENLLIHESGSLRISDFGCAIQFDKEMNPQGTVTNTVGSMAFWPPEAVIASSTEIDLDSEEGRPYSAYQADYWAAGVVLYCFLYGKLPFSIESGDPQQLFDSIAGFDAAHQIERDTSVDYSKREVLANTMWQRFLEKDAISRMTVKQAIESEWIVAELEFRSLASESEK